MALTSDFRYGLELLLSMLVADALYQLLPVARGNWHIGRTQPVQDLLEVRGIVYIHTHCCPVDVCIAIATQSNLINMKLLRT